MNVTTANIVAALIWYLIKFNIRMLIVYLFAMSVFLFRKQTKIFRQFRFSSCGFPRRLDDAKYVRNIEKYVLYLYHR